MGIRMPGISGTIDPKLVDQLVEVQKMPVDAAKKRKAQVEEEKGQIEQLRSYLSELDSSLNSLKTKTDFYKLKVESSHPDIIDGVIDGPALLGTYEFEVRGMAKTEKELAYGFPDKDETPVGFGFLSVAVDGRDEEIVIEPNSTLNDVARQINDSGLGVRALIVNTKYKPDSFRLLVVSEKSGHEARIEIDEDTTFLEFREQVTGRNLDVLFEDVPITDEDNVLDDLIDSVVFHVKRSEPGTRVQMNITYDLDASVESIKSFVEKYNQVADFIHQQFVIDPQSGQAGILAGDGSIKSVLRQLQSAMYQMPTTNGKYANLAQIGITTDPKTGTLQMDEAKVRGALAEDYDSVAQLFIRSRDQIGVADRLAMKLKNFRDPTGGVVKSRIRGLERIIEQQDKEIMRRERELENSERSIRRKFSALESQLAGLKGQGDFLRARFGGDASQKGGQ